MHGHSTYGVGMSGISDERRTILLVDDNDTLRSVLATVLDRVGYAVVQCASENDALQLLSAGQTSIDLVISDVLMDQGPVKKLVHALRSLYPTTPVAFISGHHQETAAKHLGGAPGGAFLQKPFSSEQLLITVESLLARSGAGLAPSS
jgi:two-component system cell cycle sensor histidine kinase/response regulator CckA